MTKKFCDICNQELDPKTIQSFGVITRYSKSYMFSSALKKQVTPLQEVKEEILDLCDNCMTKVFDKISELKKEVKV